MQASTRWATLVALVAATAAIMHVIPVTEPGDSAMLVAPLACDVPDFDAAVGRFSSTLRFRTTSNASAPLGVDDPAAFRGMVDHLEASYPLVWSRLAVEKMGEGGLSLLLTWRGTDASLAPALFVSHYDVVPVPTASEPEWLQPPWSGAVADGFVWGRGAMDIKFGVVAMLEAVSRLLAAGHAPARTLLLAFGHDEEIAGSRGAGRIAAELSSRGLELDIVLDEGGCILDDGLLPPLLGSPTALVAVAEKGYTSLELVLQATGGHAGIPPIDGTDLASSVGKLMRHVGAHKTPLKLQAPVTQMLQAVAHQAPRWLRPVLAASDAWPVRPLLALALSCASRDTAALVRTTVAVTGLDAFVADNVLPPAGRLNFNFRTLPGDDDDAVRRYLQSALDATGLRGDIRRSPRTTMGNPPSAITSTNSTYYALLKRAIQELWRQQDNGSGGSNSASSQQQQQPSSLADGGRSLRSGGSREGRPVDVAPLLLGGGTDSKHYAALSRHGVLRFNPYAVTKASAKLLHASNERLSLDNFRRGICTYQRIFELFGGGSATAMAA